jgi:hypothetical protein
MPRRRAAETAAIRFDVVDRPEATRAIIATASELGGRIRTLATVRHIDGDPALVEVELEVEGVSEEALAAGLDALEDVRAISRVRSAACSASGSSWWAAAPRWPRWRSAP